MTPFEISLDRLLTVETQRFANDWLFKWHNLNIEGHTVDVDRFDGGMIHLGGIKFGDQQQQIFWQAISRYMNRKVHETFSEWDLATRSYPDPLRRASIDGIERRLRQFVANIVARSTETDRALRGQGYPGKVQSFESSSYAVSADFEISKLANAHKSLFEQVTMAKRIPQNTTDAEIRRRFLLALYESRHNGDGWVAVNDIIFSGGEPISAGRIASAGRYLADKGSIDWKTTQASINGPFVGMGRIRAQGIEEIELGVEAKGVAAGATLSRTANSLGDATAIFPTIYPADASGAVTVQNYITINVHSAEFKELNAKIDELLTELTKSNVIAGEVKDKLIAEINAGRTLLSAPKPDRNIIDLLLVKPLLYIADKGATAMIGGLASLLLARLLGMI
jgi:hypothetical protein